MLAGVALSVNAVLSQLEREPYENIVDPWVAERRCLVAAALLHRFRAVKVVGAECNFPALACYGAPDALPHIRSLPSDAGFGEPTRTEFVLAADCQSLIGRHQPELSHAHTRAARPVVQRPGG
jgi:hypothetical protein